MRLDPKDLVGAGVVLGALALVAVHNSPLGHPAGHRDGVADSTGSVMGPVAKPAFAFVDFNVVPKDRDVVLPRQVVVVRGALIERMGSVGELEPPPGARIIEGNGSRYLAGAFVDAGAHFGIIAPGARADLLVLDEDPRGDMTSLGHPQGVMVRGVWHDRADLDRMREKAARGR